MLCSSIASHGAKIIHPSILRAFIAARLLGVPYHHDLGRAHSPLLFRRRQLWRRHCRQSMMGSVAQLAGAGRSVSLKSVIKSKTLAAAGDQRFLLRHK